MPVKLQTAGGGGVNLQPASSIASDVTVNVPVTGVNNGTLVCSDSSGNVGIGTSSPDNNPDFKTLTITGSTTGTGGVIGFKSSDGSAYAQIFNSSSGFALKNNSSTPTLFYTAGTERMRIDSSGNLLVGDTTRHGTGRLEVKSTYGTDNGLVIWTQASGGQNATFAQFVYNSSSAVGSITSSGTSTSYNTSSDYRLKENVQPMQNALAVVQQLNPVTYNWKADGSEGQGFIAHELQAVVPDCVTGEKDAVDADDNPVYQGIDTSFLVATLAKAIQELNEKVEAQAAEIAQLKGAA